MFPTIPVFSIVSQPFKRSQLGLFQGKTKQYGNNVPFSKHKTRRTWLPNVQRKRLFSDTLGEDLRVKLTTRALRTIKKHGGLDNYVEKSSSKILGWAGMKIRLKLREHSEQSTSTVAPSAARTTENAARASSVEVTPPLEEAKARSQRLMARAQLRRITEVPVPPTRWHAQQAREQAMKALGLESPPRYDYILVAKGCNPLSS
ncbi:ribosomal L28 family-domain-containing protein [Lyophyllum atratum]|nr:ribosomal L28 family-domain-containing protein [Lyophyllum atratum]